MQIQVFTIPIFEGEEELNAMNKFLRSHRIASQKFKKHLFQQPRVAVGRFVSLI